MCRGSHSMYLNTLAEILDCQTGHVWNGKYVLYWKKLNKRGHTPCVWLCGVLCVYCVCVSECIRFGWLWPPTTPIMSIHYVSSMYLFPNSALALVLSWRDTPACVQEGCRFARPPPWDDMTVYANEWAVCPLIFRPQLHLLFSSLPWWSCNEFDFVLVFGYTGWGGVWNENSLTISCSPLSKFLPTRLVWLLPYLNWSRTCNLVVSTERNTSLSPRSRSMDLLLMYSGTIRIRWDWLQLLYCPHPYSCHKTVAICGNRWSWKFHALGWERRLREIHALEIAK